MASTSNIRTPPATRPSLFVQTATPRGLGLATNTSRSFGGGGASPSSAISSSTRGTPQTPFQQQQQQQQKSDAVYAALDGLFDVATQHYGHSGVDEFMLRSLVEATLPMAPQTAKDALRRSLAQPSRGGGVGVFNRTDFCKALYGLFTNDYTTTAAEFTERIAAEHRRLSEGLRRAGEGLGLGVGVEGHPSSGRLHFTPEDLEMIAKINANTRYPPNGSPTHTNALIPSLAMGVGAAATASTTMGSAPPSITSPPSAALGAATAAGSPAPTDDGLAPPNPPPMAVPKEARANGPHPPTAPLPNVPLSAAEMRRDFLSIDEMEAEIRRLREKCGEAPSAASGVVNPPPAAASLLPTTTAHAVAPQSAAVMVGADGTAVPVANAAAPTQPPAAAATAAGVEAAGAEEGPFDAASAALAIGRLQAEREQTALALAAANERLHAYGRFYDRRGGAVHNARLIDAAAREARRHQQQPQPFGFPSASSNYANSGAASSAGMYPHFSNTFDPVTFSAASPQRGAAMGGDQRSPQAITRPFAGFTPQRGAMTADEVMSMLLSASPSGTSAATNPPQGLHSPNASVFYGQLQHQRPRDGSLVSTIGNSSVLSQQQQQQQSQHFSPRHNLNSSAGAYGYGNSYGAPSQSPSALPSVDYSAVSVALPSSNLAPSSDTLLAATVPIDADDARRLLLAGPSPHAAGGGGTASLHSPLRSGGGAAGYAHTGHSQSGYGAGLNKSGGLGTSVTPSAPFSAPNAPSRLDGMYHMLALEREETNRWRAYGTPHQSRFF